MQTQGLPRRYRIEKVVAWDCNTSNVTFRMIRRNGKSKLNMLPLNQFRELEGASDALQTYQNDTEAEICLDQDDTTNDFEMENNDEESANENEDWKLKQENHEEMQSFNWFEDGGEKETKFEFDLPEENQLFKHEQDDEDQDEDLDEDAEYSY